MSDWMRDQLSDKQDQVFEKVFFDFQNGFTNRLLKQESYQNLRGYTRQYADKLSAIYSDPERAIDALIEEAMGEKAADLESYFND